MTYPPVQTDRHTAAEMRMSTIHKSQSHIGRVLVNTHLHSSCVLAIKGGGQTESVAHSTVTPASHLRTSSLKGNKGGGRHAQGREKDRYSTYKGHIKDL